MVYTILAFPECHVVRNQIVCSFSGYLCSLNNRYVSFFSLSSHCLILHFFSVISSIPLSRCIHPFTYKGNFGCFQVLTIIRNLIWTSAWRFLTRFTFSFLWKKKTPKHKIGKSYAVCILFRGLSLVSSVIKEIVKLSSNQLLHFIFPPAMDEGPACSSSFPGCEKVSVEFGHSKKAGVIACVNLHFPENIWYRTCFHVLIFISDCMALVIF